MSFWTNLFGRKQQRDAAIVSEAKPVSEPSTQEKPQTDQTDRRVPGNFYVFEFFIEVQLDDAEHLGCPCSAIETDDGIRWGSKIEWVVPDPSKPRARWVDGLRNGLTSRTLKSPEDALGAEGTIGDMHVRFESILDAGKNQIVYALYCPERDIRMAFGFARSMFEHRPSR